LNDITNSMESVRSNKEPLKLDNELVEKVLVKFIKEEVASAGLSKAVIGLSGGIDSAVSCSLAARALGPENVLAVLIPYKSSSPESLSDGEHIVKITGVHSEIADITPMAESYFKDNDELGKIRIGNVLARLRMIVLYDRSAREKALVIGSSNKSEILLGYGTLHGDLASAINPIGDLYKAQVWDLAKHLKLPVHIIEKKPTADLWEGQTDEDELGFTYREVDKLLYYMIDERRSDTELRAMDFSQHFIHHVRELIRKNQFKRRMPIIAKISRRTVNIDFRYVRDWGA
jgi:NAD+ synthase